MALTANFALSDAAGTADLVYVDGATTFAEFHFVAAATNPFSAAARPEETKTLAEFVVAVRDLVHWRKMVSESFGFPLPARAVMKSSFEFEITPNERAILKHTIGGTLTAYRFRFSTGNVTFEARDAFAASRVQFSQWVDALAYAAGEFTRLAALPPLT